jgi:ribosomal protein L15
LRKASYQNKLISKRRTRRFSKRGTKKEIKRQSWLPARVDQAAASFSENESLRLNNNVGGNIIWNLVTGSINFSSI